MCIYIYIYIHVYTYIYIYIYTYTHKHSSPRRAHEEARVLDVAVAVDVP